MHEAKAAPPKIDKRPTPDQLYLAARINGGEALWDSFTVKPHAITAAAIQRWNMANGVELTTAVLRRTWGFMPGGGIENPYAYVDTVLRHSP